MRPIYPVPKIQKNYPRVTIKSRAFYGSRTKYRRQKENGYCPMSLRTRGQNPSGPGATKMDIRNAYFFPFDGTRGGSKALENVGKV